MRSLIIASKNPGKIKEIKDILIGPPDGEASIPFEIKSLTDIGLNIEVAETGKSFAENAILKAKIVGEKTGLLTLADDSGLEVDALGGRPGIHSARYVEGSDLDRINKLLKELKDVPKEKRTARFRCVIALYNPTPVIPTKPEGRVEGSRQAGFLDFARNDDLRIVTFEGLRKGYITDEPIGISGFGYDPIFFNPELGKTNGEATIEEKNSVSHRARALERCKKLLISLQ